MRKNAYLAIISIVTAAVLIGPICIEDNAADIQGSTTPATPYHLYFGDLHTHTSYSDGYGTPAEAYTAARAGGADFLATTDHTYMLDLAEWTQTLSDAVNCTFSDFVALPATEYWLNMNLGEMNVFNIPNLPPDPSTFGTKTVRIPNFYDWVATQTGASAMWNHPDYMTTDYPGGEYDAYSHLTASRDQGVNMIEIHNYGSYLLKAATTNWESSYVNALGQGWHIMPTANSDTHATDWITGYDVRTVLLAPTLTATDLYDAMSACRGYATLDKNLRIFYTLNGEIMGSELSPTESTYTASIHIEDPDGVATDEITMVEIISDGGAVVASLSCNSDIVDWIVTLSSSSSHYYYVRVTTVSALVAPAVTFGLGITAWTAPVWTGR